MLGTLYIWRMCLSAIHAGNVYGAKLQRPFSLSNRWQYERIHLHKLNLIHQRRKGVGVCIFVAILVPIFVERSTRIVTRIYSAYSHTL